MGFKDELNAKRNQIMKNLFRDQSEDEVEFNHHSDEGEGGVGQEVVASKRRDVVESGSEENHFNQNDDEAARNLSGSSRGDNDQTRDLHSASKIRDVFGDFDDEEEDMGYAAQQDNYHAEEEGSHGKILRPIGPPLELEIPLRPPPALPDKMSMIKVSNIMGIEPKPFDPKTYEEEDTFVTDEFGNKKRIHLNKNIVRWRQVTNPDGTTSVESNARFVRWSDGSLQLLIGNEALDISEQDLQNYQTHLFLRHEKGIMQSQGRLLRKMRFMPSSLTSDSHQSLTTIVESSHRNSSKVKNCITDIDPEREKQDKEKAESQNIRANILLDRKREKVNRKYTPTERRRQLSPGFLEDALDEDDEAEYYDSHRSQRHFEKDLEAEVEAEKRIMNAKKGPKNIPRKSSFTSAKKGPKDIPRKSSFTYAKSSRNPVGYLDDKREESEYETENDDEEEEERPISRRRDVGSEPEYEDGEEEYEEMGQADDASDEEDEVPKQKIEGDAKKKGFESDEDSLPRKPKTSRRRMMVVYDSDDN